MKLKGVDLSGRQPAPEKKSSIGWWILAMFIILIIIGLLVSEASAQTPAPAPIPASVIVMETTTTTKTKKGGDGKIISSTEKKVEHNAAKTKEAAKLELELAKLDAK